MMYCKSLAYAIKQIGVSGTCLLLLFVSMLLCAGTASAKNTKSKPRPKGEKIVLRHADRVSYDQFKRPDVQVFVGHVSFSHNGVQLYCDSACFYQSTNSFEGFGHVRMIQGDTLSLRGKYIYYDGNSQIAQARRGVVLKHRKTTLYTDSLNYDRVYNEGYFFEGGKLVDGGNVLTSDWGQYETTTRKALFNYNVKLVSKDYVLTSDTLRYDTRTKMARMTGPSNVVSGDTHIYSEKGNFNTVTKSVVLLDRSIIVNKDRQMVGDSVVYDKDTGVSEAFHNVIYHDKVNKNILTGDYCYYNERTGFALAHDKAEVRNYSQPDTLYLHADTFKVYTYNLKTDSVYRVLRGYYHVRSYRTDIQSVADSMSYNSSLRLLSMYGNPIAWSEKRQILGEEIHAYFNDSTIDSIRVVNQALMVEQIDSVYYNQITSSEMRVFFQNKEMRVCRAIGNVVVLYFPFDSDSTMTGMNHSETSLMRMFMENKKLQKIWTREISGTFYPLAFTTKDNMYLGNFAWFDYMRPKDKDDIFVWRDKTAGTKLSKTVRRAVPFQSLKNIK